MQERLINTVLFLGAVYLVIIITIDSYWFISDVVLRGGF